MALKEYRIWITMGVGEEKYVMFDNMAGLARWFLEEDKSLGGWGIERFTTTDNTWIDAFYCDDLIQLMWKMRDILLDL